MCTGALIQCRIGKIYIGTFDFVAGAMGSKINIIKDLNYKVEVIYGILEDECSNILKDFFKEKRK